MKSEVSMMGMMHRFLSPTKIILGNGAASQAGEEVRKLGGKRALIVTDNGVLKAGLSGGVEKSLKARKIDFGIFDKVEAEPPARIIDECARVVLDEGYDIVIGVGGGSSLDVAKGVSIMAANKGKILDYLKKCLSIDKIVHCALLPQKLASQLGDFGYPVVTWEQIRDEYGRIYQGDYFLELLKISLELYGDLVSRGVSFGQYAEAKMRGEDIYNLYKANELNMIIMGRSRGLQGAYSDIRLDRWRNQHYETSSVTEPPNSNWFFVKQFVERIDVIVG